MARHKTRELNEIRKLIDLDTDTIKVIAMDAIERELQGFKQNAERILKEYAKHLKRNLLNTFPMFKFKNVKKIALHFKDEEPVMSS